jgi:hypothetical protein
MGWTCCTHGRNNKCIYIVVGKPEVKTPLRRPWHRWEDNIRIDLRKTGWEDVDWM